MKLHHHYGALGETFSLSARPVAVSKPALFLWNTELAEELDLPSDLLENPQTLAAYFSGNAIFPESTPVAMAYAGHQFGHFSPRLGDGRAHLLGEIDIGGNQCVDVQLKGSGRTPFSRGGDGRCALGPAIREFIMSEAMAALGVPTARTLAVVTTGESVFRETPLPGAVVTRIAASHIRVGTFEYFFAQGNDAAIKKLSDFAIARHYPDLLQWKEGERYLAFLHAVIEKQIILICHWMRVGFIHGVMNTDNCAISGETIDFGPCAMMNIYSANTVFSSIDAMGRYRFGHQPTIGQWNMARFAECLLNLIDSDKKQAVKKAEEALKTYEEKCRAAYLNMLSAKIGFAESSGESDALVTELLENLKIKKMDYTQTFDFLTRSFTSDAIKAEMKTELGDWIERWLQQLTLVGEDDSVIAARMRRQNPLVIPRNHHVEAVIAECIASNKADAAERFLSVLRSPYEKVATTHLYQDAPVDGDRYYQTFCGT